MKIRLMGLNMTATKHASVLAELRLHQQNHPLSIITLAEPIFTAVQNESKRTSEMSDSENENPTPDSLQADLLHYKVKFGQGI